MIISDDKGHILQEFIPMTEDNIDYEIYRPFTHSLAVITYNKDYLLVFDKWKGQYEIPGGGIEAGETPRDCVRREIFEETDQDVQELEFLGIMKFILAPDEHVEYGALYGGKLSELNEFQDNAEIGAIKLWDRAEKIRISAIDEKLLDYYPPR